MDEEKLLMLAVFIKLMNNEPISSIDCNRFINFIEHAGFGLDETNPQVLAGLQVRLKSVVAQKFGLMSKG